MDFRIREGPFTATQSLHCDVDDESVRRSILRLRFFFEATALPGRESNVLLQWLRHRFCQPFCAVSDVTRSRNTPDMHASCLQKTCSRTGKASE